MRRDIGCWAWTSDLCLYGNWHKIFDWLIYWMYSIYNILGYAVFVLQQNCSNFKSQELIHTSVQLRKLDVTGVFGAVCRHEIPLRFLNMEHGERWLIYVFTCYFYAGLSSIPRHDVKLLRPCIFLPWKASNVILCAAMPFSYSYSSWFIPYVVRRVAGRENFLTHGFLCRRSWPFYWNGA